MKSPFTFIDLFAGCGGLSEGFVQAGFAPVAHVEMDKDACNTLKTRCCYHYLSGHNRIATYNAYLTGVISRDALYSSVPKEVTDSVINTVISDTTIEETFESPRRKLDFSNPKIEFFRRL